MNCEFVYSQLIFNILTNNIMILFDRYIEIFEFPHKIKLQGIDQGEFLLSLFSEMKEGVFLEIDAFSRKKQEDNQKILSESLYVLTSISRVLLCLLESPIYEKNYSLIDDILLILDEIIICIEKKGIIETIQTVFNPIIQNYFLIVMKWEDYLKNSWNRLKVLFFLFIHSFIYSFIN